MNDAEGLIKAIKKDRLGAPELTKEQMDVVRDRLQIALTSQLLGLVDDELVGKTFCHGDRISFSVNLNCGVDTYLMFDRKET